MHNAQLDVGFLIYRVDGVREAFQSVGTGNEDIVQAMVFEFSQHIKPEFRVLVFGQPHAQQSFLGFDVDNPRQECGFNDDATFLPDLQDDTGKVNYGVDNIQWTILPFSNLSHHGAGDLRNKRR